MARRTEFSTTVTEKPMWIMATKMVCQFMIPVSIGRRRTGGTRGMMGSLRAIMVCLAVLVPVSSAVSQGSGTEDWVCYLREVNPADPDFAFESSLRVSDTDFTVVVSHPDQARPSAANLTIRYKLVENDQQGIRAITTVQQGPTSQGYGLDVLLLNKADGSFRAGGMVIGGFYTSATGTCKRKDT